MSNPRTGDVSVDAPETLEVRPDLEVVLEVPAPVVEPVARPAPVVRAGKCRVADQMVAAMVECGVRAVFGIPGGAISAIYDALLDEPRIQVINSSHETAAVHAAAAFGRATGSVAIVLTTSGPGVTNAITGIASAYCDGLPVVVLGGEVPRRNFGRGALQEGSAYSLNVVSMVRPVTKLSVEVTSADTAVPMLRRALATAVSGRKGPVFVSLPLDVQGAMTTSSRMTVQVESRFQIDPSILNAASNRLLGAERPMILAGSGTRFGRGPQQLLECAERYGLPVATTPKAKGVFPETHPLSLGVYGYGGHPSALEYLDQGVDVMLALGTSFGDVATNTWAEHLRSRKSLIHVDIDSQQIGKNYQAELGIVAPADDVLRELVVRAPPQGQRWTPAGRRFFTDAQTAEGTGLIKPQRALWELQQLLPRNTAYAVDIGNHLMFALHYLTIDQPDGFYVATGLGAMGSSLGSVIGVKLADPDRMAVAICGDGTVSMAGSDIATAAQLGLNVIYVVMNDRCYGMVEQGQKTVYGRTTPFPIKLDVPELARGLGARPFVVERPGDLLNIGIKELTNATGPVVIDVRIDPDEQMPRKARFESIRGFVSNATPASA